MRRPSLIFVFIFPLCVIAVTLSPLFPQKLIRGMEIRDKVVALVSVRDAMVARWRALFFTGAPPYSFHLVRLCFLFCLTRSETNR